MTQPLDKLFPLGVAGCHCGALYCGGDHQPDQTGPDDGPPPQEPRKKPPAKTVAEYQAIRAQA